MIKDVKQKLKNLILEGDTFSYWLEYEFPNTFLSSHGTTTNFEVHITEAQLIDWSMDIENVKSHLTNEGFNVFDTNKRKNVYTFEIEIENLKSFVKDINNLKNYKREKVVK